MSAEFVVRRIGVVGLGHMGRAFAANLVEDGHHVSVYDQDPERAAALTGARAVAQLADLAACDVVMTSLPDGDALAAVALGPGGLVGILAPGAVHVSTSTVSPAITRRVTEAHTRRPACSNQRSDASDGWRRADPCRWYVRRRRGRQRFG